MSDFNSLLTVTCFSFAIYFIFRWRYKRSTPASLRYPPGPKGHPIIGNLLQIPSSHLWEKAVEWGKEYGDLIYLECLGQKLLLVNSYEDATELLTGRSAKYSSRPSLIMTTELEGFDWVTSFMPYGDTVRKHRSIIQPFVGSSDTVNYLEIQLSETRAMLKYILDDPDDYGSYAGGLPGAVVLMNVYGHQVVKNDPYIDIGQSGVKYSTDGEHYFFLDVLPWLKYIPPWFPWAKFHQVAKEGRKISHAMKYDLYEQAKQQFLQGTLKECMTSVFLSENMRDNGTIVDEDYFTAAAATLYLGGVDTSATAMMSFVMQMLKNPEVQRKAQLEIDTVLGTTRLPTFDDKGNLPYVRAIIAEVLRLAVITPFIIAHSTTEDDVFQGYHIPSGTAVLANAWAMSFNTKDFPEPLEFKPERWLISTENGDAQRLPYGISFGFGRRLCPGQLWAENLLFIAFSSMLATFNMEKAIDENGNPISPNESYSPGFARQLGSSKCKITPRSPNVVSLVESYVYSK